jgi:hypothetical protein
MQNYLKNRVSKTIIHISMKHFFEFNIQGTG